MTKTTKLLAATLVALFALTLLVSPSAVLAKKKQGKAKGPITAVDAVAGTLIIHDLKSDEDVEVTVDENTSIHKDKNENATLADLAVGDNAKVHYNKETLLASRVHAKSPRVKGEITAVGAGAVTIQPEEGDPVTVFVTDETKLKKDDELATLEDLAIGDQAKAWYDAATMEASKLIVTSPEVDEEE